MTARSPQPRVSDSPFTLTYATAEDPALKRFLIKSIERLTGRVALERLYLDSLQITAGTNAFWPTALAALQVDFDYPAGQLQKIPPGGPLVLIANHPFGVVDGLIICHLASLMRGDFRILINRALCREERLAPYFLPIDFSGSREGMRINIESRRIAIDTLRAEGTVIVFPAGGIATARKRLREITDLDWKPFAARMIQASKATVVPIYFHGGNSWRFQLVSRFSLTLRLSLIISEVMNKRGTTIRVSIGDPIPFEALGDFSDRQQLTRHLRALTHALAGR